MSRFDNQGIFWQDQEYQKVRGEIVHIKPPIPISAWRPLRDLPNLSTAKIIGLDTETYDPELLDHGPGWARGVGNILGISLATDDGFKCYLPIRHEEQPEYNLDPINVLNYLRDLLKNDQPKIGANLTYDLGWLTEEGISVGGKLYDIQFAEALLVEKPKTSLEYLGQKYLSEGKDSNALYEWLAEYFGGEPNGKQRKHISKAPITLVAPYAESDADLPIRIFKKQYPLLKEKGLIDLFNLECDLIPVLIKMRRTGVRLDIDRAEQLKIFLEKECKDITRTIKSDTGVNIDVWQRSSLEKIFKKLNVNYPKTPKGQASFTANFLDTLQHPIGKQIRTLRQYEKLGNTFIDSYLLHSHKKNIVYCSFNQLKEGDTGTITGRFSSTTPNLQNIPVRTEMGRNIRRLFIPFEGHAQWRKFDYSQIEYRFLAHFAVGQSGDDIRKIYNENKEADFHEITKQLIKERTGKLLDRRLAKNINFGLSYGMGLGKLAASLNINKTQAKDLFSAYHSGVPFVKATFNYFAHQAALTGEIRTVLNRCGRFDFWEASGYDSPPLLYAKAVESYGIVKRAFTHTALNKVLQGSSADQLKYAMLTLYKEGLFDKLGYPSLTVHDELDFSDAGGNEADWLKVQEIMEQCLKLQVPVKVDCCIGLSWGDVE